MKTIRLLTLFLVMGAGTRAQGIITMAVNTFPGDDSCTVEMQFPDHAEKIFCAVASVNTILNNLVRNDWHIVAGTSHLVNFNNITGNNVVYERRYIYLEKKAVYESN